MAKASLDEAALVSVTRENNQPVESMRVSRHQAWRSITMSGFSDDFVYFVIKSVLKKQAVTDIARALIKRYPEELTLAWGTGALQPARIRTKIHAIFREGIERGFVRLNPQLSQEYSEQLGEKFMIDPTRRSISVVNVRSEKDWTPVLDEVTEAAADLVVELIITLGKRRKGSPVAIGFGAGHTTMNVARRMGQVLSAHAECPPLTLHTITSGFSTDPRPAPITFFRFFDKAVAPIDNMPLFSAPTVRCEDYEDVKQQPVVRTAFQRAAEIDVVITSLADMNDPDGLLNLILEDDPDTRKKLLDAGWVGDVQFLPYSQNAPIKLTSGIRAVTLFELSDLLELASQENKYVVLVAGPCNLCGALKTNALRPLLKEEGLRMWSHLVTDLGTAKAVLEDPK